MTNNNKTSIGSMIKSADKTAGGVTKNVSDLAKSITGGVGVPDTNLVSDAVDIAEGTLGAAKKFGNVITGRGATPPEEAQKSGYSPSSSTSNTSRGTGHETQR